MESPMRKTLPPKENTGLRRGMQTNSCHSCFGAECKSEMVISKVEKISKEQKHQRKMLAKLIDAVTEIKAKPAGNIKIIFNGPACRCMQICLDGSNHLTNHYQIQGRRGKPGNSDPKAEKEENITRDPSTAWALGPATSLDRSVRQYAYESGVLSERVTDEGNGCDNFDIVEAGFDQNSQGDIVRVVAGWCQNCLCGKCQYEQARSATTQYNSLNHDVNDISDHSDSMKGCKNSQGCQQVSSNDESIAEYDSESDVDDRQEDNRHEPDGTLNKIDDGGVVSGLLRRPSSTSSAYSEDASGVLLKRGLKRATRRAVRQTEHLVASGNANNPKSDMPGREAWPTVLDGSQTNADSEVGTGAVGSAGGGRELDMTAKGQLSAVPQAFEKQADSGLETIASLQDDQLSPRFGDDQSPVIAVPDYGNDPSKGTSSPQGDKISPWPGLSSEMTEDTDSVVQLSDMRDQQSFSCQANHLNIKMGNVLVRDSSGTAGHCLEGTEQLSNSDDRSLSVVASGSQQSVSALSIDSELVGSGVQETGGPPNPLQGLVQAGKGLKGLERPQSSGFHGPMPMIDDAPVSASGNGEIVRGVLESEPPFSAPLQGTDSEQINSGMNKIEDYLSDGFPDSLMTDADKLDCKGQFHAACDSVESWIAEREGFRLPPLSHPVQEGDVEESVGSVGTFVPETGRLVSDFTETNKSPSAALSDSITNSMM